jgi:hypothetical protein
MWCAAWLGPQACHSGKDAVPIDADLYLPALLEGFLGSRRWMAARMGKVGGAVSSEAKAAPARANGRLGGRPKKPRVVNALAASML